MAYQPNIDSYVERLKHAAHAPNITPKYLLITLNAQNLSTADPYAELHQRFCPLSLHPSLQQEHLCLQRQLLCPPFLELQLARLLLLLLQPEQLPQALAAAAAAAAAVFVECQLPAPAPDTPWQLVLQELKAACLVVVLQLL
jgi:hypothetical protein